MTGCFFSCCFSLVKQLLSFCVDQSWLAASTILECLVFLNIPYAKNTPYLLVLGLECTEHYSSSYFHFYSNLVYFFFFSSHSLKAISLRIRIFLSLTSFYTSICYLRTCQTLAFDFSHLRSFIDFLSQVLNAFLPSFCLDTDQCFSCRDFALDLAHFSLASFVFLHIHLLTDYYLTRLSISSYFFFSTISF